MIIKLTDEFLNQYHIKDKSNYNDNYYRLPFAISYDGEDFNILHIMCDEFSNEYSYGLIFDDGEDFTYDSYYIKPSSAEKDYYELDCEYCYKEYIWI